MITEEEAKRLRRERDHAVHVLRFWSHDGIGVKMKDVKHQETLEDYAVRLKADNERLTILAQSTHDEVVHLKQMVAGYEQREQTIRRVVLQPTPSTWEDAAKVIQFIRALFFPYPEGIGR